MMEMLYNCCAYFFPTLVCNQTLSRNLHHRNWQKSPSKCIHIFFLKLKSRQLSGLNKTHLMADFGLWAPVFDLCFKEMHL